MFEFLIFCCQKVWFLLWGSILITCVVNVIKVVFVVRKIISEKEDIGQIIYVSVKNKVRIQKLLVDLKVDKKNFSLRANDVISLVLDKFGEKE